jgi:DNA-binding beta-propeller fold protein YncE
MINRKNNELRYSINSILAILIIACLVSASIITPAFSRENKIPAKDIAKDPPAIPKKYKTPAKDIAKDPLAIPTAKEIPIKDVVHLFDTKTKSPALTLPTDVAVNADGEIVVVDSGNDRVVIFNKRGKLIKAFGSNGSEPGQFNGPVGLTTDSRGNIYVADKDNNRIQVFNRDGKFIRLFNTRSGTKKVRPVDVAISHNGKKLYVTDNKGHKVVVYSSKGKYLQSWGTEGVDKTKFRYPATLDIDKDNKLHVVDVFNSRVQILGKNGKHILDVGSWGVLPGQLYRPKGVEIDTSGNVYVSDSYMELIQVYDAQRRFSHVIGKAGEIRRFSAPTGIAVQGNRLYVTEMLRNVVSVYRIGK